jgi:uncharacterized protein
VSYRSSLRALTGVVALALVATACSGGSSKGAKTSTTKANTPTTAVGGGTGSLLVNPLFVAKDASGKSIGGTNPVTVRIGPSSDHKLRVGFTEDEVAGTGDQWQAAGWSAVTVATLLIGAPLTDREVDFDVTGKIDGPSAGGLMTVATLALMRGDKLLPDITMTGTINPDGTIGPVGGIPYKVDGVLLAHKKRMLIPAGQRNSANASGQLVDVVQEGQRKGITVTEVDNIYDAYKAFTGKDLPRTQPASTVKLDEASYQKLKAKVETWNARFSTSVGEFNSLTPTIRGDLQSIADQANSYHQQATKLSDEGLQAGAFQKAVAAAAFANAAAHTGQNLQILLTQGVRAFVSRIKASESVAGQVNGLVDELKTFTPATVSDAGALIAAYGNAIDAVSFSLSGQNLLAASASTAQQAATQATLGAVYYDLAGTLVDASKDVLDVGRDLGGAKPGAKLDLNGIADFFRRAAEANLNAFESLIIEPAANDANISVAAAKARFADNDSDYALAVSGLNVMGGLQRYFGNAASSDYAEIGGAVSLYNRSAGLLAKYYSLGEVDPKTLDVTGISNDQAFSAAIDLAQNQLASTVALLSSKSVSPTIAVADNEVAGVDREGSASDKLNALTEYWDGYLSGRVLAYIGGFADKL